MKQRIITGIIFGIIVLALLLFADIGRLALLGLIPLLASLEYFKITKGGILDFILAITLIAACYAIHIILKLDLIYFIVLCCLINVSLILNLFKNPPIVKHLQSKSVYLSFYLILPFLLAFHSELHSENHYALISIMLLIWISDSCAYFVGSRVGKRKLFPSISPKKTWEGFYGAGMCVFISAYVIGSIFKINSIGFWMLFALIVWVIGSLGDLVASHVKRIHSVKDSGSILPGHGGFFDRFDAFIFVLPFILLLIELKS